MLSCRFFKKINALKLFYGMSLNRAVNKINLYSELSEVYELSARLIALTKSGFPIGLKSPYIWTEGNLCFSLQQARRDQESIVNKKQ